MLKRHVVIVRALVVLAVMIVLGMAWSAPVPYRVDIGRFDAAVVQGFYDPEFGSGTTFRWSQPQATLTLAGVGAGAYQLDIHATAPAGTVVTVTVADNPPQTLQLNTGFVRYSLPHTIVVPWQWPPQPLTITLTTANPTSQAQRLIGVAVDDVRLTPTGWQVPDGVALLQSSLLVLVLAAVGRWLRIPMGWSMLVALIGVTVGVLGRRGDAATAVQVALLVMSCSWVLPPLLIRQRRYWFVAALSIAGLISSGLWWRGVTLWQPVWQLGALALTVSAITMRRLWWPWLRPWRWWGLAGGVLAIALTSWLGACIALLTSLLVWQGRRTGPINTRFAAVCRAVYSVFTVLDAWLCGRYVAPVGAVAPRRVGLDVIRAFAIVSVLIGHASALYAYYPGALTWLPYWFAYVGVECFFVLSGWLIGGLLIRQLDTWQSPTALAVFLHRRWVRTLPTYWLVLGLVGVVGWGGATLTDFVPYLVFSQNIWHAHPPFLFVAWSLSIEEWFYLITAIALSLLAIWWRPATALRIVLLVLVTVPWLVRSGLALTDMSWEAGVRQLVPLRLDALAMGVVLVWWWQRRPIALAWLQVGAVVGSLAVMTLFALTYTELDLPTWWRVLLLPLTTLSVACWLPWLAQCTWPQWPRLTQGIQWLALISYPLYLLHTPWRLTVEGLFGGQGQVWWADGLITIVYIIGSLWLAHRWHLLLERPLMQLRWRDDN